MMRILFGVQGTGNGHISRSRTLARALRARGLEVDYLFSGRPADGYFEMAEFGDYRAFPGITFVSHEGAISGWRTLGALAAALLARHAGARLPRLRPRHQRFRADQRPRRPPLGQAESHHQPPGELRLAHSALGRAASTVS